MLYKNVGTDFFRFVTSRVCQTDRQTDRQTNRIFIARRRLHSMQHGNKNGGRHNADDRSLMVYVSCCIFKVRPKILIQ